MDRITNYTPPTFYPALDDARCLLEYDEIVVFNNYAQMAIDTYINMNYFNYIISCHNWSTAIGLGINDFNRATFIVNPKYSKTSLFTLGYKSDKVVDTKLYFNLINRVERLNKVSGILPLPASAKTPKVIYKLYPMLVGRINHILKLIYIGLFSKFDKAPAAQVQEYKKPLKTIADITSMRVKCRSGLEPIKLGLNVIRQNKYKVFLGYSRRIFSTDFKPFRPCRYSLKDRSINNIYYSRHKKLILILKKRLYFLLETSYV